MQIYGYTSNSSTETCILGYWFFLTMHISRDSHTVSVFHFNFWTSLFMLQIPPILQKYCLHENLASLWNSISKIFFPLTSMQYGKLIKTKIGFMFWNYMRSQHFHEQKCFCIRRNDCIPWVIKNKCVSFYHRFDFSFPLFTCTQSGLISDESINWKKEQKFI